MKCGVQMFSLRKYLKEDKDYIDIFGKVKAMGAEVVQLSSTGSSAVSAEVVKEASEKFDLPVCITHDPWNRLADDLDSVISEHQIFGCKHLGVGMMPKQFRTGKTEDILAFAEKLEAIALRLKDYDMTVSYHNHWFEFDEIDGEKIYDILIDNTKELCFIPDTYWMRVKGQDIEEYLKKLTNRVNTIHLKDYKKTCGIPLFRAIGKGELDFASILETAGKCGVENAVVELDFAFNPLKSIEQSMFNLMAIKDKLAK